MSTLAASTVLEVLHAAHAHGAGPSGWADDVRELLLERVPGALAVESSTYDARDGTLRLHGSPSGRGRAAQVTLAGHASLDREARRAIYETDTFVRSARAFFDDVVPEPLAEGMAQQGIGDIVGIAQPAADRRSAYGLTLLVEEGVTTSARSLRQWGMLIRHLGALAAVRHSAMDDVVATDADTAALVRALDHARARTLRRSDEETAHTAVDLWSRILDGGFTIVEHATKRGGGRVVAVRADDRRWAEVRRLTPEERSVVALVARGLSNKEVAYELGVDATTVERRLRRAQQRLGLRSRVELVRLAQRLGALR
jgi:DNA-binding NarL/FixJ family response regulator